MPWGRLFFILQLNLGSHLLMRRFIPHNKCLIFVGYERSTFKKTQEGIHCPGIKLRAGVALQFFRGNLMRTRGLV